MLLKPQNLIAYQHRGPTMRYTCNIRWPPCNDGTKGVFGTVVAVTVAFQSAIRLEIY